jgi:hypothetical protein
MCKYGAVDKQYLLIKDHLQPSLGKLQYTSESKSCKVPNKGQNVELEKHAQSKAIFYPSMPLD